MSVFNKISLIKEEEMLLNIWSKVTEIIHIHRNFLHKAPTFDVIVFLSVLQ